MELLPDFACEAVSTFESFPVGWFSSSGCSSIWKGTVDRSGLQGTLLCALLCADDLLNSVRVSVRLTELVLEDVELSDEFPPSLNDVEEAMKVDAFLHFDLIVLTFGRRTSCIEWRTSWIGNLESSASDEATILEGVSERTEMLPANACSGMSRLNADIDASLNEPSLESEAKDCLMFRGDNAAKENAGRERCRLRRGVERLRFRGFSSLSDSLSDHEMLLRLELDPSELDDDLERAGNR